jgi:hypothetical protein
VKGKCNRCPVISEQWHQPVRVAVLEETSPRALVTTIGHFRGEASKGRLPCKSGNGKWAWRPVCGLPLSWGFEAGGNGQNHGPGSGRNSAAPFRFVLQTQIAGHRLSQLGCQGGCFQCHTCGRHASLARLRGPSWGGETANPPTAPDFARGAGEPRFADTSAASEAGASRSPRRQSEDSRLTYSLPSSVSRRCPSLRIAIPHDLDERPEHSPVRGWLSSVPWPQPEAGEARPLTLP